MIMPNATPSSLWSTKGFELMKFFFKFQSVLLIQPFTWIMILFYVYAVVMTLDNSKF